MYKLNSNKKVSGIVYYTVNDEMLVRLNINKLSGAVENDNISWTLKKCKEIYQNLSNDFNA